MQLFRNLIFVLLGFTSFLRAEPLLTPQSVSGLYYAMLRHDDTDYFQYAKITLRTINPDGRMQISANVRVFFGPAESNEYFTYEFADVPLNLLTRQLSIKEAANDISMIGFLRDEGIQGEWFSTLVGKVGNFIASKEGFPPVPEGSKVVEALSGYYRGTLENINPLSNLPYRVTLSFVTTQENNAPKPTLHISGSTRFYLGEFESQEYFEIPFKDIQFNFYNRFLTAKTSSLGLTFKGTMEQNGTFEGMIHSDANGRMAKIKMHKMFSDTDEETP